MLQSTRVLTLFLFLADTFLKFLLQFRDLFYNVCEPEVHEKIYCDKIMMA